MRRPTVPLLFLTVCLAAPAYAGTPIDRVEEDWELVVTDPSPDEAGPQITTTMSPTGDNSQVFIALNLNYRDAPFRAGGLQAQTWSGGKQVLSTDSQHTESLATPGETIRWTQRLEVSGGLLRYAIDSGQSTTWTGFGQGGNLNLVLATTLADLSAYRPGVSSARSGVSWQANRVASMTLLRVRYYAAGQLVSEDDTPRTITLGD